MGVGAVAGIGTMAYVMRDTFGAELCENPEQYANSLREVERYCAPRRQDEISESIRHWGQALGVAYVGWFSGQLVGQKIEDLDAYLYRGYKSFTDRCKHLLRWREPEAEAEPERESSEPEQTKIEPIQCKICMDNKLTHVCVPCGHTFCKVCSERNWQEYGRRNCMTCAQPIR